MQKAKQTIGQTIQQEEGFTLLEVLLSVAIFGFIALSLVQMSQDYIQGKRSTVAAEHMKTIHNAAYRYIMENFQNIYTAQLGGDGGVGTTLLIPIENDGVSTHYIKRNPDLLPANFNATSPFGQTVVVLLRNAGNRNIEVVSMSTGRPAPEKQVEAAASSLGGYGGFWSAVDRDPGAATTSNLVIGAYGMWSVPVTALTTPVWPGVESPTVNEGGYLASYQWINYTNEIGDYLYRIALPLAPEANAMMTNIDMNNYNIDGADNVDLFGEGGATTSLTVLSSATMQGSATVSGTSSVTGDLTVSGTGTQAYIAAPTTINGAMDMDSDTGVATLNLNNFIRDANGVDGTDVVVGTAVTARGSVTGIEINTETTEAATLTMSNADMLAVVLDVNQINVGQSGNWGSVETNILNGGTITTDGAVRIETLSGANGTTISGPGGSQSVATTILGDSVMRGNVRIEGVGGTQGRFSCDVGC